MKKFFIFIFVLITGVSISFGQSDELLDKLYQNDLADTFYTSLIVLQASGNLSDEASLEDAKEFLMGTKWGESVLKDEGFITTGGFSLLVMESFNLPHGLIYNILPIRRYALKEMVYLGYLVGNPYSDDLMSSFDVIYALSSIPVDENINKNYVSPVPEVEPTTVEPAKVEPAKVEPAKVEPAKVEPAKVEPAKVEPAKVEPVTVEPAKVEPAKVEPAKVEPAKVEPVTVEPATVEPTTVEPTTVEPATVE